MVYGVIGGKCKMKSEKGACLLCGDEIYTQRLPKRSATVFSCSKCGQYIVSDLFPKQSIKLLSVMRYYIKHEYKENKEVTFFVMDTKHIYDEEYRYVDVKC